MPAVPLSDEQCREVVDVYRAHFSIKDAADAIGISRSTFRHRLNVAKARGFLFSDGARKIIQTANLSPAEARGGWIHNYDDDGKKIGATRWSAEELPIESIIERILGAFDDLKPSEPVDAPKRCCPTVWHFFHTLTCMWAWL